MASNNDPHHRRNLSTPQSIPLRNLNRPPDEDDNEATGEQRQRALSDRGRNLLRQRDSVSGRPHWTSRYEPIAEASPSPTRVPGGRPQLNTLGVGSSYDAGGRAHHEQQEFSPIDDASAFQSAIGGFAGLSFHGESSRPPPAPHRDSSSSMNRPYITERAPSREDNPYTTNSAGFFSPVYDDTARLTDPTHLAPISGAASSIPSGQPHDRTSFQSVRFLTPEPPSPHTRFSYDAGQAESGALSPGISPGTSPNRMADSRRTRSLSPSVIESPLARAGTMMRHVSQRVVNITNEPEVVERSIRRKSSVRHARLEGPPALPAMPEYAHDGAITPPPEKAAFSTSKIMPVTSRNPEINPLRGKSLGVFGPDNPIRTRLCDILVHPVTEPFILVLIIIQTVLLAVESSSNVYLHPRSALVWGSAWIDYALLGLFVIYTLEVIVRVIVSGLFINPVEYSTINRQVGLRQAILDKGRGFFTPQRNNSIRQANAISGAQPSIVRAFTSTQTGPALIGDSRQQQRVRLAHRAFLRHSFNRLDFVAVVSFWISFSMSIMGEEVSTHIYVFRMLSCLRILRLLLLTSGTTVILRSLKKAAPLLVNVAFLISFFWLLFAIIGVQSFKSSMRRSCVWVDPEGIQPNFTNNGIQTGDPQNCGGYLDSDNIARPWKTAFWQDGAPNAKGYLCPQNSFCVEGENPHNGTVSFDNIFQSLELVFVVMSSNTWSDLMYTLTESDYLVAALFFAAGIVIMSLWLINLLIAVITSSFQVIREESRSSAFTGQDSDLPPEDETDSGPKRKISALKRGFAKTFWLWIAVISYGLIVQTLRSATMSQNRAKFIDVSETIVTLALMVEIILRLVIDWRFFFRSKRNVVDLLLAIITTVIQLPPIRAASGGRAYSWLTIFQILRIYRVVLAVPLTRDLIVRPKTTYTWCNSLILA